MPLTFTATYLQLDELAIVLPPKQPHADDPAPTREDSLTYLKTIRPEWEDWQVDQRHQEVLAKWNAPLPRITSQIDSLDAAPEQLVEAGLFPAGRFDFDEDEWLPFIARDKNIAIDQVRAVIASNDPEKVKSLYAGVQWGDTRYQLRAKEARTRCPSCGQPGVLFYATDRIAAKCSAGCSPQALTEAITRFVVWCEAKDVRRMVEWQRNKLRATVSLRQAFANTPEAEPQLIDGVLPAGALVMLHAPSGGRKTMTAISWLVAVAAGKPWLGRPTRQASALAILLEGARSEHVRWIRQLAEGMGASLDDLEGKLDLYPAELKADDLESLRAVANRVQALEYKLVVIDNLSQIHSGGHGAENDARAMHAVLHPLEQLVRSVPGLTIVVLHHANASGDPRGRDGIKQHFDRSLSLEASSDRNNALITLIGDGKRRDGIELEDLRWRFNGGPNDPALILAPVVARRAEQTTADDKPEDARRAKLLSLLPATAGQIYAGMGGNRNAVAHVRAELEDEGLITLRDGLWVRVVE